MANGIREELSNSSSTSSRNVRIARTSVVRFAAKLPVAVPQGNRTARSRRAAAGGAARFCMSLAAVTIVRLVLRSGRLKIFTQGLQLHARTDHWNQDVVNKE